jgi:hypothetical protein
MVAWNICKQPTTFVLIAFIGGIQPCATVCHTSADTGFQAERVPWPRQIVAPKVTIEVYQPQLEQWSGNKLEAYAAVAIKSQGLSDKSYGVIWFTARTEIDKVNRLVTLDGFRLTRLCFPSLVDNGMEYLEAFQTNMSLTWTIPLDLLETSLVVTNADNQRKYQLENEEPHIIFSTRAAFLILIDGDPVFRTVGQNLQMVTNTRAHILFDPDRQMYYVALMDGWLQAPAKTGQWSLAEHVPTKSLDMLRRGAHLDGRRPLGNPEQSLKQVFKEGRIPMVYLSTVPAELLLTQGQPKFAPIAGTNLLYVENSGDDIFLHNSKQLFYVRVSGRWFMSKFLQTGSWSYVPPNDLPSDFAAIPADSPKASVLVSVPGTPQANEALITNQIPQTAAISREAATLHVTYYGAPDFQQIEGTRLLYAVNTISPVVYIPGEKTYYAVQNAVWFRSPDAGGPWTVATSVPPVIYTIPPSCPIHYVTYARVYDYTPTTVYVGYTPGYYGTVVSWDNVVVYGTGWRYQPFIEAAHWIPRPYTYGVGATFSWTTATGWDLTFGLRMTSGHEFSSWWLPVASSSLIFEAQVRGRADYRGASAANVYGCWENNVYAGTIAAWANPSRNYRSGDRILRGRGFAYKPRKGNDTVIASNDLYADHDGNIYRASPGLGWQQHISYGWSTLANATMRSFLDNWQAARALGARRWGNFDFCESGDGSCK